MLAAYREEYEATPSLTIKQLLAKYKLSYDDIQGYETWVKECDKNLPATSPLDGDIADLTMHEKIEHFKEKAIDHCLAFMANDARFSEVKEFKDVVAIVDSIEKSYKATTKETGPTINILVQNLMERFSDDC